jgi:hypothetical protein
MNCSIMKLPLIVALDIFLRANTAPVALWNASQTTPNLPSPSFFPKWKSCRERPLGFGL